MRTLNNHDYDRNPRNYLVESVESDVYTWEQVARAFMYQLSHDAINEMIRDQGFLPEQECEVCYEHFTIEDLTVEEHSEVVCCHTCLPQRQDESRQEQLENGELDCPECGEDQLDENGECPTCMKDPEY